MKKIRSFVVLFTCLLLFSLTTKAGHDDNNGRGNAYGHDKHDKDGGRVPIDGGITLLLAAGAALGAKKLFHKNKKNSVNPE